MACPYVELEVTSNYGFLRAASHPEELVTAAAAVGYAAIGTAERNSLAGAVRMHVAAQAAGLRLVVVADRAPTIDGVQVEFRPWSLDGEVTVFGGIAVGLMPLADSEWARAKCAFKAIQYMALGIPTVLSPVGMNREVVEHGVSGFLADGEQDWVEAIDLLLKRPETAAEVGAANDWGSLESRRAGRPGDRNPYIEFDPAACIACARCTRYCDEVEAVTAITLAGRGSETTISTVDQLSLLDTTCEMCGGCIDTCPTGAMREKMPVVREDKPEASLEKVRTTCNYCGVGCQLDLNVDREADEGRGRVVKVTSPPVGTTTNDGNLCVKGRFAYDFVHHTDRLTTPLVRDEAGELREASWEEALARAAAGLAGVAERHGKDALGFVSSSRCTVEENYLVQKMARAVYGTNNVHQCAAT